MSTMISTLLCLSIIILVQFLPTAYSTCPAKSPCTCDDYELYCHSKGLTNVPSFTAVNTTSLTYNIDLRSNIIHRVEGFAFTNLSLEQDVRVKLMLDNNPVEYVDNLALEGLQGNVLEIHMRDTNLTILPDAFTVLKKLRVLVINAPLQPSVMMEIGPSLLQLYLVGVPRWPTGLQYATQLLELEVTIKTETGGDNANHIPTDAFSGFEHSLQTLLLNGQVLSHSPDVICRLQNLSSLTLGDFDLAPNISAIPSCQRPMNTVHSLQVFRVPVGTVSHISVVFPALKHLYLNDNGLITLPDDLYLPTITTLDLELNHFTRIPPVIRKLKTLRRLYMMDNKIASLETNSVRNLPQLTYLYLDHNPISSIDEDTFTNTPKLALLSLRNTSLTTVPKAIRPLWKLTLDLRVNRLKCSCELAWLLTWEPMKSGQVRIEAQCYPGTEGLTHYISTHLSSCEGQPIG